MMQSLIGRRGEAKITCPQSKAYYNCSGLDIYGKDERKITRDSTFLPKSGTSFWSDLSLDIGQKVAWEKSHQNHWETKV